MEKLLNKFKRPPSRLGIDVAASYVPGDCNVCHQRGVKVKKLACGEHNCCRMCVEFVPRLVKGDFSCRICDRKTNSYNVASQQKMDLFFSAHTGVRPSCDDVMVGVDGHLISCEDSTDLDDLNGYNDEWDHLLLPNTHESNKTLIPRTDTICHQAATSGMSKIPRKSSILRLGLPMIDESLRVEKKVKFNMQGQSDSDTDTSGERSYSDLLNLVTKGVTILSPHRDKPLKSFVSKRCAFEMDPNELERGSSPCKAPPGVFRPERRGDDQHDLLLDSSQSETDQILEEIGTIDGPSFLEYEPTGSESEDSYRKEPATRKLLFDEDFWDMDF